jgi:hypothetical protein
LISSSEEIIEQSQSSLAFHIQIQAKLEASELDQQTWCDIVSEIYVRETAERTRQTEILSQLEEHVSDKWNSVAEYLQTRQN